MIFVGNQSEQASVRVDAADFLSLFVYCGTVQSPCRINPWSTLWRFRSLALLLFTAMISSIASAAPVTVINPSFESQVVAPGTFSTTAAPTGWQAYGDLNLSNRTVGVLNPNSTTLYLGGATEGNNVGVVFLLENFFDQSVFAGIEAGMQQTLSSTLQAQTRYTLRVDVGNIANDITAPHNQFAFGGFPGYRVDLLAGGNLIGSDNNTLVVAEGTFETSTIEFTTGSSVVANQALGIRLVNLNQAIGIEVNFDNVRLDATAIPEPSSMLLCFAFALLMRVKRRNMIGAIVGNLRVRVGLLVS